ncbi:uncharacterized protein [Aegilops tauschii subsp. strangulata]|nr:uncharacterized protein LOC109780502 isoform X2 [Aegilops tauschii subsp. strangulata]
MAAYREDWKEGRPSPLKRVRPEERSLNHYVLWQTYVLMAVRGLGYLALLWSTVVLLGGFVTLLRRKDFWCLATISMLQASRIVSDVEDQRSSNFAELYVNAHAYFVGIIQITTNKYAARELSRCCYCAFLSGLILCWPVIAVLMSLVLLVLFIHHYGHFVCVVLSLWRIVQRDYGSNDGDGSKANMMPALDIFYSLVLCQGALWFIWVWISSGAMWLVVSLRRACKFPEKWGSISVSEYLLDTLEKCWRDPMSIHGRKVINYAVDLLDSDSQKDYLSGARMLDTFIKLDADVRSVILPSRPKIQKLIDTVGSRSSDREIRELAARIIAYLAGDIHLTQFPGAIRCISSVLDTTLPYWNNQQGHNHYSTQSKSKKSFYSKEKLIFHVRNIEERRANKVKAQEGDFQQDELNNSSTNGSKGAGWNELILQGMTILEKLVADQQNCSDICSTPGLLPKIMAPLNSETLIQDISINAWADIVNGSFKVLHRLICVPEWTGRWVHSEIASSEHAVSNLEEILDEGNRNVEELQMRAIEILTELALDMQTDLSSKTKEILLKKQLQIFLTDGEPEEHDSKFITERLKVTAGKTLALLAKTATVSALVVREYENIVEVLDAKNKIIYRTIAAEILENLCIHHKMDKEHVKTILLPKVLREVLTTEASESNVSALGDDAENHQLSALGNDEEKQLPKHKRQMKSADQANEEQTAMMELQEAFLSLTLVICTELISADDFDDVARKVAPAEGGFVAKLKTIIEENCEDTANSLRIVKLCGQIAVRMMRRGQYSAHFKDQKFVETLSKASIIMSNLESCMLFAGTDCGTKKTARPLLSDLVKEAHVLVA